ncbi:hypothetical protein QYE76_001253 [Lolium multiflorum]|uniref:Uncharacterized protein n=1 Tax=Lolium multiflorum TaxID=4521 RepID=A0AAD8RJE4_LOLMU|nr:hypothetical protein QYE76_001253 [Lolium multiflorum]
MTRIHELQNTRGKELSGIQITAYFLKTRVQPLQDRKNPFWKYAGDEDTDRLSTNLEVKDLDRLIRKISSLKKKDSIPSTYRVTPYSAANALPKPTIKELLRIGAQFLGYRDYASKTEDRTSQEFELEDPDNDSLLDAVSFLEFHGTEAREGMDEARAGCRAFPLLLLKKEEPATFLGLAKCFNPPEDLGLKMRHENMKARFLMLPPRIKE